MIEGRDSKRKRERGKIAIFSQFSSTLKYNPGEINNKFVELLLDDFYPVTSPRPVRRKEATNYCIHGSVTRYGPQSVARRKWLIVARLNHDRVTG